MGFVIGRAPMLALVVVAVASAVAAFAAGGDVTTALPLALVASCAAAGVAGLALADRLKPYRPEVEPADPPPSVVVYDGLVGGAFGRQQVVQHLQALERKFSSRLPPVDAEEEARLLKLPKRDFLRWVNDRVAHLEAAS